MSSNASSSGIESDTDSSPSLSDGKHNQLTLDMNNVNDRSIDTIVNDDDDDEGFSNMDCETKDTNLMSTTKKQFDEECKHEKFTSKLLQNKSCHFPFSKRNPYDEDLASSSVVEDWDEECKLGEPYYFPGYIRQAQWPNHWRWTPPLGIRYTHTQQLHRHTSFQPANPYDDIDHCPLNLHIRHFSFDFQ